MIETRISETYPKYILEDRSVAIPQIPGWVWGLMLALIVAPMLIFTGIWGREYMADLEWEWLLITLILLLLHEGTHAVAWKVASKLPWKVFSFGVQWKTLTPYCHSKEPMPVNAYRIGAITPLIVTGLIPWIISLVQGDADLALASALLISGAGGDIYILWSIRDLPEYVMVQDHDTRAGCLVLWPKQ